MSDNNYRPRPNGYAGQQSQDPVGYVNGIASPVLGATSSHKAEAVGHGIPPKRKPIHRIPVGSTSSNLPKDSWQPKDRTLVTGNNQSSSELNVVSPYASSFRLVDSPPPQSDEMDETSLIDQYSQYIEPIAPLRSRSGSAPDTMGLNGTVVTGSSQEGIASNFSKPSKPQSNNISPSSTTEYYDTNESFLPVTSQEGPLEASSIPGVAQHMYHHRYHSAENQEFLDEPQSHHKNLSEVSIGNISVSSGSQSAASRGPSSYISDDDRRNSNSSRISRTSLAQPSLVRTATMQSASTGISPATSASGPVMESPFQEHVRADLEGNPQPVSHQQTAWDKSSSSLSLPTPHTPCVQEPEEEAQPSHAELGIGVQSKYVHQLRKRTSTVWCDVSTSVWGLPIGISTRNHGKGSALTSRTISIKKGSYSFSPSKAYLRRAMDVKHSHLTPRLLASEVDEDDEDMMVMTKTKTPTSIVENLGGGNTTPLMNHEVVGHTSTHSPHDSVASQGSAPSVAGTSVKNRPRAISESSVKSVEEGFGKIKLFVANPDSD